MAVFAVVKNVDYTPRTNQNKRKSLQKGQICTSRANQHNDIEVNKLSDDEATVFHLLLYLFILVLNLTDPSDHARKSAIQMTALCSAFRFIIKMHLSADCLSRTMKWPLS